MTKVGFTRNPKEIRIQVPEFFKVASSLRHPWRKRRIRFLRSACTAVASRQRGKIANYLKLWLSCPVSHDEYHGRMTGVATYMYYFEELSIYFNQQYNESAI